MKDLTLGKRISVLRKQLGMKQEELAEKMGVSPQAVSKWENDQTCPDISLLLELSQVLGISSDELLSGQVKNEQKTELVPEEKRKDLAHMVLRIEVDAQDGDHVKINLPVAVVKIMVESNQGSMPFLEDEKMKSIDFSQVLSLVEEGVIGEILSVDTADGDRVRIYVE